MLLVHEVTLSSGELSGFWEVFFFFSYNSLKKKLPILSRLVCQIQDLNWLLSGQFISY